MVNVYRNGGRGGGASCVIDVCDPGFCVYVYAGLLLPKKRSLKFDVSIIYI